MLTTALIRVLDKTYSPRGVRAVSWMLEKSTGFTTTSVSEWYQRNGYYRIGGYAQNSHAGISINASNALEASAFYAGVKVISEDMASMPFVLYRRDRKSGTVDRYYDHPLYRTLHDQVNPELSAGEFVESMTAQSLFGNAYAWVQRIEGRVYLWPWQPDDVRIERNRYGAQVFVHREADGSEKPYPRDEVFYLRGFTLDGVKGDNLISRMRHTLGLTLAAEKYAGSYFASSAMTHLVLERPLGANGSPNAIGPEGVKALKEAWKTWHAAKAWEPAVLQEGMTAKLLQPKHAETQLIEQRTFQVIEMCRVLRIPPHRLAELSRSTNNNIEQQSIDYTVYTLGPHRRRWRQAVDRCLLTEEDRADPNIEVYAEHNMEALLRGDFKTQTDGFRALLEKGVYSINEVRAWFNLNPINGGDAHFIQLNMQTVVDAATGANLQPEAGIVPVQ